VDQRSTGGKNPSYNWAYGIALVASLVVLSVGIYQAVRSGSLALLGVGCGSVVAVLIAWPIAAHLSSFQVASCAQAERALTEINERFEQFSVMLNLISEQQLLSDRAKSVAFRDKDSEALRRAIQEEILEQHWEAALSLANEIENAFGFKQEADSLRAQIADKQNEHVRKHIADATALIERHVRGEAWQEAYAEANRIAQQFPDSPQATALPAEVDRRREAHKKQLIDSWNDAVNRHDVDGGIEILKRLDTYLTPTEAEAYQETARSIFKEKIGILRTQFSVAVQDRNWTEAIRLAETIIRDFPNSQMAKEVRDMMDNLRARAGGLEPAEV
jgi:hypothetical protein